MADHSLSPHRSASTSGWLVSVAVFILVAGCSTPGSGGAGSPAPSNVTSLPEIHFEGDIDGNSSYVRFRADFDPSAWDAILQGGHFTILYSASFPNGHPGGFVWAASMFAHLSNPKNPADPADKRISGHGFMAWVPAGTQTLTAPRGTAPSEDAFKKYSNGTVYFYMGGTLPYHVNIQVALPALRTEQLTKNGSGEIFRGSDPVQSTNEYGDTHASSVSRNAPLARTLMYGMLVTPFEGIQENLTRTSGRLYLQKTTNCSEPSTSGGSGLPRREYVLQPPASPNEPYAVFQGAGVCQTSLPVGTFKLDLTYRAFQDARPLAVALPFDLLRPSP